MEPEIILSLFAAEQGFGAVPMCKHLVESKETLKTWEILEALVTPLGDNAWDKAVEYGAAKEQDGFLNGFRVAVRLLMESLCVREGTETGSGADRQSGPGDRAEDKPDISDMTAALKDKAENVQAELDVVRVLRDAVSESVRWFTNQDYINEVLTATVRDVSMDVQTLLTVLEDRLRSAREEQDEIVSMLTDIQRTRQTKSGAA